MKLITAYHTGKDVSLGNLLYLLCVHFTLKVINLMERTLHLGAKEHIFKCWHRHI